MSSDFSLIGYESVPVAEYLPILQKIKDDLNIIYDAQIRTQVNLNTDVLNNSIMQPQVNEKGKMVSCPKCKATFSSMALDTIDGTAKSLQPEVTDRPRGDTNYQTKDEIESMRYNETIIQNLKEKLRLKDDENNQLKKELTRKNGEIESMKVAYNELQSESGNSVADDSIDVALNLRTEIQNLKEELSSKIDEIDQLKDEITRRNGKIESLKAKYKESQEALNDKDIKIKSLSSTIKSQIDELTQKDENIRILQNEMERIQMETSTIIMNENKKENPELQKIIEDQSKKISNLESIISKFEAEHVESNYYKEKNTELENKIINLETKNEDDLDQNYLKLMSNLKKKREEIRERDNKINDLESEVEDIKMKNKRLEKVAKTLTTNYENLKQEFDECERFKEKWEEDYKVSLKQIKKLKRVAIDEEEIVKYKNELKDHKDQLKKKDNELKQNEKRMIELEQANESLSKAGQNSKENHDELEKCKLEIIEKGKDLEEKAKKIIELQEECAKKQQAMVVMREKIRGKTDQQADVQDLKKLNYKLRANEMELEQAHRKIENLNSAYEEKAKEYDLSVKQNQNLQGEIANLKKLFNSKDQDLVRGNTTAPTERPDVNEFPNWWKMHMPG